MGINKTMRLSHILICLSLFITDPVKANELENSVDTTTTITEGKPKLKSAQKLARKLGLSIDDVRPDQQLERSLFGSKLIIGGELSAKSQGLSHLNLSVESKDDNFLEFAPELTLEAMLVPSKSLVAFASLKAFSESKFINKGDGLDASAGVEIENLWLLKSRLLNTNLALQIGKQRLQDEREWWWDESFDSIRLHYFGPKVTTFVGLGSVNAIYLSTEGEVKPEESDVINFIGSAVWSWSKRHEVQLFALHQVDKSSRYNLDDIVLRNSIDDSDAELTWLGIRASGCFKPKFPKRICYWSDLSNVQGTEIEYDFDQFNTDSRIVDSIDKKSVEGWAFDVGITVQTPLAEKSHFTISHARGSGDRPGTPGRDGAFRQTGFHSNDGRYRGGARFNYYGEVLQPNLSNIEISTVALGIPIGSPGWVEFVLHRYSQSFVDNRISGSRLKVNPNGVSSELGEEIDVVISYRPKTRWQFGLTAGVFRAGEAFGEDKGALSEQFEVKLEYNF